jgi:hypothetical protein
VKEAETADARPGPPQAERVSMSSGSTIDPRIASAGRKKAPIRAAALLCGGTLLAALINPVAGFAGTGAETLLPAGPAILDQVTAGHADAWQVKRRQVASASESEQIRGIIGSIQQRTKTRQIRGGENLNVMEWTLRDGPSPVMDGAIVYFKKFASAFKYFNERFDEFMRDLPRDWDGYGRYQEPAKRFSHGDIGVANRLIVDIFEWFKPKQEMIGNQGGVLIIYRTDGTGGAMVAYADRNRYKQSNVAGILTGQSYLQNIILGEDIFRLPPGADEFIRVIIEDQEGVVRIEVPYILFDVPAR